MSVLFAKPEAIMPKFSTTIALLTSLFLPAFAAAQERVVLVELFTSQGCMACPPADEYVTELSARDGVLPLSLHVDYWDYLGWQDQFAKAAFTQRQKDYAYAHGVRSVYTPQIVIGGAEAAVGHDKAQIEAAIARQMRMPADITLTAEQTSQGMLVIGIANPARSLRGEVHVIVFAPERTQHIPRGENEGRTLSYTNVVLDWQMVVPWDGGALTYEMPHNAGENRTAVIVQEANVGTVLAAVVVE